MPQYYIIVCTKCRKQARIIEDTGAKTTRCHNCGARLKLDQLRKIGHTDSLEDAINRRSQVQAELMKERDSKWDHTFKRMDLSENKSTIRDQENIKHQDTDSVDPELTDRIRSDQDKKLFPKRKVDPPKNKDLQQLLLSIIRENNSISRDELQKKALEHDISEKRLFETIRKLLQKGEIYSPRAGIFKTV